MNPRTPNPTSMIVAFGAVAFLLSGAPGQAQVGVITELDPRLRYVPPEPMPGVPAPLPRECTPRYMAGPGTGLVLGMASMSLGGTLVWAGSTFTQSGTGVDPFIAGGSLMIGAGLAVLVYSSVKLTRNQKTRDRVCREGDSLQTKNGSAARR